MDALGTRTWVAPEGYIPEGSTGPEPEVLSHETACVLTTSSQDAHLEVRLYFSDREPVGPHRLSVPARRTRLGSRQAENALLTTVALPA